MVKYRDCVNFRDLGGLKTMDGKTIKHGLFYRSGALNLMNEEELEEFKKLKINSILDLRTKRESDANPDPVFEETNYLRHSGMERKDGKEIDFSPNGMRQLGSAGKVQYEKLLAYYSNMPFCNEAFRIFFATVKEGGLPICFHCFTGKDRTGILALVLEGLLKCDRQTLVDDYQLSNYYHRDNIKYQLENCGIDLNAHPETKELLEMCYGVRREIGEAVYDNIMAKYGSFENLVKNEYGYSDEDIENLRKTALE